MERLDDIDIQILKELQRNAKLTVKELADKVHLSASPTFERQKRLEREGYIENYVAVVNPKRVGNTINRSLQHQAETTQQQSQSRFHGGSTWHRRGDRVLQHFGRLRLHDENLCARHGALSRFCAQ